MKKYFCVADVHGFFNEMMEALKLVGFEADNANHVFVCLGDLLDRGPQPQECLDFVNNLPADRKILIRGNHEELMRQMLCRDWPRSIDKHNGTWKTVRDITQVDAAEVMGKMRRNSSWWTYYHNTEWYKVVGDYILVHGWIPSEGHYTYDGSSPRINAIPMDKWDEIDDEMWKDYFTWYNGMEMWNYHSRIEGKTVICGHWNTSWGWMKLRGACTNMYEGDAIHDPFIDDGIVALDACTVVSHKVNCFVFEA